MLIVSSFLVMNAPKQLKMFYSWCSSSKRSISFEKGSPSCTKRNNYHFQSTYRWNTISTVKILYLIQIDTAQSFPSSNYSAWSSGHYESISHSFICTQQSTKHARESGRLTVWNAVEQYELSRLRISGRFLTDKALWGVATGRCIKTHTMHLQCF